MIAKNVGKSMAGKSAVTRVGFSVDEIQELKQAFNLFDTEGDGHIDPVQVKAAMKSLGFEGKSASIFTMISQLSTLDRRINFNEFLEAISNKIGDKESKQGIDKIFNLFDDDNTNSINLANLTRIAKQLGETMRPQQLQQMLQRAVENRQEITRQEFYRIMIRKHKKR